MVKKGKKNKKFVFVILMLLAVIVIAGYNGMVYAASAGASRIQASNERGIVDPFSLNFVFITSEDEPVVRPPIRITERPEMRSYFRPPLVY